MRLARRLIITALILGVLAYGADVIAKRVAAGRVASQAQASFHTPKPPVVTIGGFPFLFDLLNGRIAALTIDGVDARDQDLKIAHLRITLRGIHATVSDITAGRPIGIDSGLAEAQVTEAEIDSYVRSRNPNVHVRVRRDGVVVMGRVAGGSGTAEGRPKLVGRLLTFTPDKVAVQGRQLSGAALIAARKALSFDVDIPELPGGVRITAIEYDPGSVRLAARLANAKIDLSKAAK